MTQQELVTLFIERGYLPSPDISDLSLEEAQQHLIHLAKKISAKETPLVFHKDFTNLLQSQQLLDLNWLEFEKSRVMYEKGRNKNTYKTFLDLFTYTTDTRSKEKLDQALATTQRPEETSTVATLERDEKIERNVILVHHYPEESRKRTVKDFVDYFRSRYAFLKNLLQQRQELQHVVSISRALQKQDSESVALIGIVYDKIVTGNGNILITLEDTTGIVKVFVGSAKQDLFQIAEKICVDEVIGVSGNISKKMVFSNSLIFPDVPLSNNPLKHSDDDVLAAFISDIHFGSKHFLEANFVKFIDWVNGKSTDEHQQKLSKKLKYLFVIGDVVDGVGVYPGQEKDLLYTDIREQYHYAYTLFSQLRQDLRIIMCPGNHDATRATEPQPPINKLYAPELYTLPHLQFVSNPCLVNIHSSKQFEGFNVLMYHGASFHYYIDNVPQLRQLKARDNPGQVLRLLLQKRHLAPSHSSTTYVPYTDDDPLLIKKVPDVIVSGDMHKSDLSHYNGVIVINSSCWQKKTAFQEKTGNNPDPCKVPLFHLKTRETTMLDFSDPPPPAISQP